METLQKITTSRLILRDEAGRLIMGIRPLSAKKRAGELDFFGGKIDEGENPKLAAIRETLEETGLRYNNEDIFPHHKETDRDGNLSFTREYYIGRASVAVSQISQLPEHIGVTCVTTETALELVSFEPHRRAIIQLALHL